MIILICIVGWFLIGGLTVILLGEKEHSDITVGDLLLGSFFGLAFTIVLIFLLIKDIKVIKKK